MKSNKRNLLPGLAFFLISLAGSAPAFSQASPGLREQINKIQTLIDQKGGKWVAGETSMSGLSPEEVQSRIGLTFTEMKEAPLPETPSERLPSSVDWRNAGGNFVTPIRNQAKCGDCWAFALTGALESYVMREQNAPGADLDLSEQVMLSCSGIGSCNGGTLNGNFLQRTGLPPESDYPYTAADGTCSSAAPGWENEAYKIDGWAPVSHSLSAIKSALAKYGPLPTGMLVYEDLMHYKSGVYSYTTGKKLGGHAVIIVGYNDAGQYLTVKNSWGTGWGENGFFRIAYSEMDNSVNFGLSTIAFRASKDEVPVGEAVRAGAWSRVAPMFEPLAAWK